MMLKRKVMFAALAAFMAFFAGVAGASEYVGCWVSAEGRGEDGKRLFPQEGMSICFEKRPGAMDLDAAVKTSKEAMGILQ